MLCGATTLSSKPSKTMDQMQRAVFKAQLMWNVGTVLPIYIFDYSDIKIISKPDFRKKQRELAGLNDAQAKEHIKELKKFMYWDDYSAVSSEDLDKFFDPLYKTIQGKVSPGELVKAVVNERLNPLVGVKFTFTDDISKSIIRIRFDSMGGSNSYIGTDNRFVRKNEHTMNLGWLDVGTTIHEFCHVLGMVHEHQNPQGNPIQWNVDALNCYYREKDGWTPDIVKRNIIDRYSLNETNGSNFDRASIMIYSFPSKVLCDGKSVDLTSNGVSIRSNFKLSPTDILWLQNVYPKNGVRDPNFIKNFPKEAIQTEVFDPKNIEIDVGNIEDVARDALNTVSSNRTIFIIVGASIVGLILLYVIYQFFQRKGKVISFPRRFRRDIQP